MRKYTFSLTGILPYKNRIYDYVFVQKNTGQWKLLFSRIICIVVKLKVCYIVTPSLFKIFFFLQFEFLDLMKLDIWCVLAKWKTFRLISIGKEGVTSGNYEYKGTFRTLSNIHDETLCAKIVNGLELLCENS